MIVMKLSHGGVNHLGHHKREVLQWVRHEHVTHLVDAERDAAEEFADQQIVRVAREIIEDVKAGKVQPEGKNAARNIAEEDSFNTNGSVNPNSYGGDEYCDQRAGNQAPDFPAG